MILKKYLINHKRLLLILFLVLLILVIGAVLIKNIFLDKPQNSYTFSKSAYSLEQGLAIYQKNCASCHGQNLEGQPNWQAGPVNGIIPAPPHDQTGHTWHHDDDTLFKYIKLGGKGIAKELGFDNPNSNMPAYKDILSDHEILATINYIKSTWPEKVLKFQSSRNQQ